ncbi:hypothetical protein Ccar_02450 [Clostridium carboxidivorans P7]|uniref:Zinc finger SWIM domain protein n=1 Tax=Clostridium carboxidivorans P7 TaxID=536227 RepID=C6Q0I2_9CLOT|nr:hypothetical protein [Clostridium carboxidivorans]AKN29768.1 hypothetical protein Ccar_02450 [Clostridium carboxidivorans P7]EET84988.1 zinc finger SWIM domain protein [Clostridium carboxidivorans P7]EFG89284.1 SWIM zinc finger domain-containing protein [Clostridium carboxidivorans P7]
MTNLELLVESIREAQRGRFLHYDNPKNTDEKIVIDIDTNVVNMVTVKDEMVDSCTCKEVKPCKHMVIVSIKFKIDMRI